MDTQILTLEQDTINYNVAKEVVIAKLVEEGLLSKEDGEDFVDRCQLVLVKNGWFKRWCMKFAKGTEEKYTIRILEMYRKVIKVKKDRTY